MKSIIKIIIVSIVSLISLTTYGQSLLKYESIRNGNFQMGYYNYEYFKYDHDPIISKLNFSININKYHIDHLGYTYKYGYIVGNIYDTTTITIDQKIKNNLKINVTF